jgi:DNA primase
MSDLMTMYEEDVPGLARKVSSHRGGEYHGPCPVCGGEKRFRIQPEHGEHGFYACRDCGISGDDVDYLCTVRGLPKNNAMKELRGDLPGIRPVKVTLQPRDRVDRQEWHAAATALCREAYECLHSAADSRGKEYLSSRGLTDSTIRSAGLGFVPSPRKEQTWGVEGGVFIPGPAVVIPQKRGDAICGVKFRCLNGDVRYMQIKGSKPVLYGADRLERKCAILTEGEFDALLLRQEAGDLCDVMTLGSASAEIPTLDLLSLCSVKLVLISYDLDDTGMAGALKLASAYSGFMKISRSPGDLTDFHLAGNSLRNWAVEELLLNGADIPLNDIAKMYNARLARHDDLEAAVDYRSDEPKQKRMIEEHARMCDHMNRLITAIRAAGYTITGDEILHGYEV